MQIVNSWKLSWKATFLGREEGESFQKPSYYRSNRAGSKYSRAALPEPWRRGALVLWGWGLAGLLLHMQRWLERAARCRTDVKREFQDKHQRQKPRLPLWKISLNTRTELTCPTLEKASQNQQEESHLFQEHNISLLKKIIIIIIVIVIITPTIISSPCFACGSRDPGWRGALDSLWHAEGGFVFVVTAHKVTITCPARQKFLTSSPGTVC